MSSRCPSKRPLSSDQWRLTLVWSEDTFRAGLQVWVICVQISVNKNTSWLPLKKKLYISNIFSAKAGRSQLCGLNFKAEYLEITTKALKTLLLPFPTSSLSLGFSTITATKKRLQRHIRNRLRVSLSPISAIRGTSRVPQIRHKRINCIICILDT